jgi:hypothetical protein
MRRYFAPKTLNKKGESIPKLTPLSSNVSAANISTSFILNWVSKLSSRQSRTSVQSLYFYLDNRNVIFG